MPWKLPLWGGARRGCCVAKRSGPAPVRQVQMANYLLRHRHHPALHLHTTSDLVLYLLKSTHNLIVPGQALKVIGLEYLIISNDKPPFNSDTPSRQSGPRSKSPPRSSKHPHRSSHTSSRLIIYSVSDVPVDSPRRQLTSPPCYAYSHVVQQLQPATIPSTTRLWATATYPIRPAVVRCTSWTTSPAATTAAIWGRR